MRCSSPPVLFAMDLSEFQTENAEALTTMNSSFQMHHKQTFDCRFKAQYLHVATVTTYNTDKHTRLANL